MADQTKEALNCPECKKAIKKNKRYYRNGKYYCNKKCWRKSLPSKEGTEKT